MKVGVTGASGFIGKHVVRRLDEEGFEVFSMGTSKESDIYLNLNETQSIIWGLKKCKPDFLVHLASPSVQGIYRGGKELNIDEANALIGAEINGAHTLFRVAGDLEVKKIVYTSSAAVYGRNENDVPFNEKMPAEPHTIYGAIKLSVEKIGQSIFSNFVSLRLFQVYGEGDIGNRLVPTVINAKTAGDLQLTPCLQVSDLIYVKDVANCICEILKIDLSNGTFNLGCGVPLKLREVVAIILEVTGKNIVPNYEAKNYSGNEVMYSYADMSFLFNKILWRSKYSFIEGLIDFLACS